MSRREVDAKLKRIYVIVNERNGVVVASKATFANNPWSRMKGLLGKSGLDPGEALIIRPCSSVHTAFMRFPIDVIFVDRTGKVLKIARRVAPFRFAGARRAHDTIEMAAGSLDDVELAIGDTIRIE